jgi:molybdopterin converting factor subunit 1
VKSVNIKYFAQLRELSGKNDETINVDVETYGELYSFLASKYNFPLPQSMIQIAVNDEYSTFGAPIEANARIVFIPPVSGG